MASEGEGDERKTEERMNTEGTVVGWGRKKGRGVKGRLKKERGKDGEMRAGAGWGAEDVG